MNAFQKSTIGTILVLTILFFGSPTTKAYTSDDVKTLVYQQNTLIKTASILYTGQC